MAAEKKGLSDLKLTQKLTLLTALVGAVASMVACGSFIIFDLAAPAGEDFSDRLQRHLLLTALVLLASSLVTMLVSHRFRRLLTDPITVLAAAMVQVTEEGTCIPLHKASDDEVGSLVTSFNAMMDTLAQREHDLRASKALFDRFMDNSPAFASIKDAEGRYLYLNPAACRLGQTTAQTALGKRDTDLWPAELAQDMEAHDQDPGLPPGGDGKGGGTGEGHLALFPEGRSVCLLRFPLSDGALGTVGLDETERLSTLAALRRSEERYALAVRGVNPGIWDWQVGQSEVYYSPRWQQMLGYADGEIEPCLEEWLSRVHKEDKLALQAALDAHLTRVHPPVVPPLGGDAPGPRAE
jgi:PAS domain-containing protein